jgi:hypothetical protein
LASAGEDFFLFCDPPVTPAFAFLLTGAAAALGGPGTDAVTNSFFFLTVYFQNRVIMIYVQNNICNFVYDGNLIFFPRY